MNGKQAAAIAAVAFGAACASGAVVTGSITNWEESGQVLTIGDGVHHVRVWWSVNTYDRGWFYGSTFTQDSDVALAEGVTNITQIENAATYIYSATHIGPCMDADLNPPGDFIVWKNNATGHFGVLRIDNIHGSGTDSLLDATWWFQTDGTGSFVPAPASWVALPLFAICGVRRRADAGKVD